MCVCVCVRVSQPVGDAKVSAPMQAWAKPGKRRLLPAHRRLGLCGGGRYALALAAAAAFHAPPPPFLPRLSHHRAFDYQRKGSSARACIHKHAGARKQTHPLDCALHIHDRGRCGGRGQPHGGVALHLHISHLRERSCTGCLLPQVHGAQGHGAGRDRLCAQLTRRPGRDLGRGDQGANRRTGGVVPQRVAKGAGDGRGRGGLHAGGASERRCRGDGEAADEPHDERLRGEPLVERKTGKKMSRRRTAGRIHCIFFFVRVLLSLASLAVVARVHRLSLVVARWFLFDCFVEVGKTVPVLPTEATPSLPPFPLTPPQLSLFHIS
ncbi:acylphosphatase, putative [Leishmania donovani]|uniref:Acylphosphatase, putative n=1 Tax=Leishmania donovani TaxID=5661 RepID=E9BHV8_LEIDO|nr:acylphosphatase, putative [Leishmania donovani]CBZ34834.1 acylphosphatase, putative [Leishmania donovani]